MDSTALGTFPRHIDDAVRCYPYSMTAKFKRYYRPEFDALRFTAFLAIFLAHGMSYYSPGAFRHPENYHLAWAGQWCVPLFCFLSAFLIVELLLRELDNTGTVAIKQFYMRRILRIWPLYFLAFALFAMLNHWLPGINTNVGTTWPYFLFFMGNWYMAHHGLVGIAVDPMWTVSVEEQFYLFIPIVALLGGRKALRIVSYLAIAAAYLTIYRFARDGSTRNAEFINSFVEFQFFGFGALMAIGLRGRVPGWGWAVRSLLFGLGVACWVVCQTAFGVRAWMPVASVAQSFAGWPLVLIGCGLIFLAFLGISGDVIPGWVSYMGRISYGLYVFHLFVYHLVFGYLAKWAATRGVFSGWSPIYPRWGFVLLALAGTVAIAHLSYHYVELPFLRLKDRFTVVASRPD